MTKLENQNPEERRKSGRGLRETSLKLIELHKKQNESLRQLAIAGAMIESGVDPKKVKTTLPLFAKRIIVDDKLYPTRCLQRILLADVPKLKTPFDLNKLRVCLVKGWMGALWLEDDTIVDLVYPIKCEDRNWTFMR